MSNRINIDIVGSDAELREEVYRIIAAHYPEKYIHSYAHVREYLGDQKRKKYSILLIHDIEVELAGDLEDIKPTLQNPNILKVVLLTKPKYRYISDILKNGFDDFVYISENEDLITSRLRVLIKNFAQGLEQRIKSEDSIESLELAANLISAKIPGAKSRSKIVSDFSVWAIKQFEDISKNQIRNLRIASELCFGVRLFLSDKQISTPILKDGHLSSVEMNQLPHFVDLLLPSSEKYEGARDILSNMYENLDGSGMPKGKKSWQIPIESRTLRVAMDFEELLHSGIEPDDSYRLISKEDNRIYDRNITSLLPEYIREHLAIPNANEYPVHVLHLREGMTLTRELMTRQGLKLLPKGKTLNQHTIDLILSHTKTDPISGHIYVSR